MKRRQVTSIPPEKTSALIRSWGADFRVRNHLVHCTLTGHWGAHLELRNNDAAPQNETPAGDF
jgi:hypothetical protein